MNITRELFKMQDLQYKNFQSKLVPNLNSDTIIGVRTPELRSFARRIKNDCSNFLSDLPHKYYEENNLHSFIISEVFDFDKCINLVQEFLPYIDNWATCDGLRPKCFAKNKEKLIEYVRQWLKSGKSYTVRFAIEMLMVHYFDESFSLSYPELVSKVVSDDYYVNMMIAWYFATALAMKWDDALPYIKNNLLSKWVHNKAIQKAVESRRISIEKKEYLKSLRR